MTSRTHDNFRHNFEHGLTPPPPPFEQCSKKLHFSLGMASLTVSLKYLCFLYGFPTGLVKDDLHYNLQKGGCPWGGVDHYCHKVFLLSTNVNSFEILILYRIFISFSKFERYWRRVFEVKLPFLCPVWSERSVIKMREKGISFKPSGSWILLHTQPFCAISRACMGRGVDLGGKNGEQYNNAWD